MLRRKKAKRGEADCNFRAWALVAQYAACESLPGVKLNGKLTLGDNSADTAGLTTAYDAYHHSLGGKPASVIDGPTGDQRFFLGFAQVRRTPIRRPMLLQAQAVDPHSPDRIRTRTVRNFEPWYAAFPVKPGDALYLAPKDRVHIGSVRCEPRRETHNYGDNDGIDRRVGRTGAPGRMQASEWRSRWESWLDGPNARP